MDNNNEQKGFTYTYSAKEQEELRKIRQKYAAPTQSEDKMEQLRRLDAGVTTKATAVSLTLGIIGALVMGTGMSLAMTDLGELWVSDRGFAMLIGILIGLVGIVLVCLAYPTYNHTVKKEREKIAPEILRITEELLK